MVQCTFCHSEHAPKCHHGIAASLLRAWVYSLTLSFFPKPIPTERTCKSVLVRSIKLKQGVQCRMVLVVKFFVFFEIIIFCFVIVILDLVHYVVTMHDLH